MDAATINARIYAGRAKAAARIGTSHHVYRPNNASNPLNTLITSLPVAFNAADNTYARPQGYGKAVWYADMDGSQVEVGDYLVPVAGGMTYFVAALQSLLPVMVVACPRAIRIIGPAGAVNHTAGSFVGSVPYFGIADRPGQQSDVLGVSPENAGGIEVGWPASILMGGGSERQRDVLPASNIKQMGWQILLPASLPVTLMPGMRVMDDMDRPYVVGGAELSALGWRVQATEAHE